MSPFLLPNFDCGFSRHWIYITDVLQQKANVMGWDDNKYVNLPDWSANLRHLYWVIRIEGRIKAKRLKYYRKVEKEKLRLAELGVSQTKIADVCRYLCNFKNANTLKQVLSEPEIQLSFSFYYLT
jgi:hypothetical protein